MKSLLAALGSVVAFFLLIILVVALGWGGALNDFAMFKFFAPKRAAIEREVFENTPSYVQGMKRDLADFRYQFESPTVTDSQKHTIASVVRERFAAFDTSLLSPQDYAFLRTCQNLH